MKVSDLEERTPGFC